MDDDKGLDLSLGLPCGRKSDSVKGKNGSSSDEVDRDSKLINDFKNFLEGGTIKHDSSLVTQRNDPVKKEENFFNNLSKPPFEADTSKNLSSGGLRSGHDDRSAEVEQETRPDIGDKRKSLFGEVSQQKKREREAHHSDLQEKTRASHISLTTDEGSTAENEDVADSEVVASTSRLIPLESDGGSKRHTGNGGSSEIHKEVQVHQVSDSNSVELLGQRRFTVSSEKELKFGNMGSGLSFPAQASANVMNMSYSLPMKDANTSGSPGTSSYPLPGMMQMMAAANSGRPGSQQAIPTNLPLMFGYSPVQLPTLDKDSTPGMVLHQQQLHPSYAGRGQRSSDDLLKIAQVSGPVITHKSSESPQYNGRVIEQGNNNGKHNNISGEGSASRIIEDDEKASNNIFRRPPSEQQQQPRTDVLPSDYPAIRPGIAAELKFGGCGSYPNLPWVSTTGPGPNGKTISGVTYKYSPTQIRIVCACHGTHMSPEEFVRHAGEGETNLDAGTSVA